MNAEQNVTAAKTRSDFRPGFSNMDMRKNPHCVENGGHGTRADVRITATPRIEKRIADCGLEWGVGNGEWGVGSKKLLPHSPLPIPHSLILVFAFMSQTP
jgi:hypothetical protein